MSNIAFDNLVRRQEIRAAADAVACMEAALASGNCNAVEVDWITRDLPIQKERLRHLSGSFGQ